MKQCGQPPGEARYRCKSPTGGSPSLRLSFSLPSVTPFSRCFPSIAAAAAAAAAHKPPPNTVLSWALLPMADSVVSRVLASRAKLPVGQIAQPACLPVRAPFWRKRKKYSRKKKMCTEEIAEWCAIYYRPFPPRVCGCSRF